MTASSNAVETIDRGFISAPHPRHPRAHLEEPRRDCRSFPDLTKPRHRPPQSLGMRTRLVMRRSLERNQLRPDARALQFIDPLFSRGNRDDAIAARMHGKNRNTP